MLIFSIFVFLGYIIYFLGAYEACVHRVAIPKLAVNGEKT